MGSSFLLNTHTGPGGNVSHHFLLVASQTAAFPERAWKAGMCKWSLWTQLHFHFCFWLAVMRLWLCWCEKLLLHVAQLLLSLWAVLMYTAIILLAMYCQGMSSSGLSPRVLSFFGAGLRKSLDGNLVQDHKNRRCPQPRTLLLCLETVLNCSIYPHDSSAAF